MIKIALLPGATGYEKDKSGVTQESPEQGFREQLRSKVVGKKCTSVAIFNGGWLR
jgi:hypothetical protein